jgi:hypothetical protein
MLRFIVLSVALPGPETILAVVREVTRIKKGIKRKMFESNRECTKRIMYLNIMNNSHIQHMNI